VGHYRLKPWKKLDAVNYPRHKWSCYEFVPIPGGRSDLRGMYR